MYLLPLWTSSSGSFGTERIRSKRGTGRLVVDSLVADVPNGKAEARGIFKVGGLVDITKVECRDSQDPRRYTVFVQYGFSGSIRYS